MARNTSAKNIGKTHKRRGNPATYAREGFERLRDVMLACGIPHTRVAQRKYQDAFIKKEGIATKDVLMQQCTGNLMRIVPSAVARKVVARNKALAAQAAKQKAAQAVQAVNANNATAAATPTVQIAQIAVLLKQLNKLNKRIEKIERAVDALFEFKKRARKFMAEQRKVRRRRRASAATQLELPPMTEATPEPRPASDEPPQATAAA